GGERRHNAAGADGGAGGHVGAWVDQRGEPRALRQEAARDPGARRRLADGQQEQLPLGGGVVGDRAEEREPLGQLQLLGAPVVEEAAHHEAALVARVLEQRAPEASGADDDHFFAFAPSQDVLPSRGVASCQRAAPNSARLLLAPPVRTFTVTHIPYSAKGVALGATVPRVTAQAARRPGPATRAPSRRRTCGPGRRRTL